MATCANCGAALQGPFCSVCGEKHLASHDFGIVHFSKHVLHDLTHFDTKVFRSVVLLLFKPGFLTAEFTAGRWKRYIKPTTLFILINLFFFFAKGGIMNWSADTYVGAAGHRAAAMVSHKAAERHQSTEQYLDHFNDIAREKQHSMFFVAIPAVALVSLALFRRRYFVEHLVYSIHFHAFLLLFLTVGLQLLFRVLFRPLIWVGLASIPSYLGREPGLNYLIGVAAVAYHSTAIRRAFSATPLKAVASGGVLTVAETAFLIYLYQPLMFYWVYYSA